MSQNSLELLLVIVPVSFKSYSLIRSMINNIKVILTLVQRALKSLSKSPFICEQLIGML